MLTRSASIYNHCRTRLRGAFLQAGPGRQRGDERCGAGERDQPDRRRSLSRRATRPGRFDPPYSTVSVGTISGGTARNILAKECRFNWEIRGLPGLDIAAIEARFAAFCRSVETHRLNRFGPYGHIETLADLYVPGLAPDPGSEAERIAVRARSAQYHHRRALRHRGRPVPEGRSLGGGVRPGQHRPGAISPMNILASSNSPPARPSCGVPPVSEQAQAPRSACVCVISRLIPSAPGTTA